MVFAVCSVSQRLIQGRQTSIYRKNDHAFQELDLYDVSRFYRPRGFSYIDAYGLLGIVQTALRTYSRCRNYLGG